MPLIPLDIPPGVYRNGTEYESRGRWFDTNLVRWREGKLEPVGGWQKFDDTQLDGKARGMLAWRANDSAKYLAIGTNTKLYGSIGGTFYDITPSGFATGRENSVPGLGWGASTYGSGDYGTQRQSDLIIEATTWSLDNWGEYLVACSTTDGKIYEWQLSPNSDAAILSNAPDDNVGLIVTNERYLVALGANGNKRKVQWSDQEDNNTWTPAATNTAGSLELETAGQIKCARRVGNDIIIWTDVDVHLMRYVGPPFVYGIERVASGAGVVSNKAVAVAGNTAVWLSESGFWTYDGSIKPLQCDAVLDVTDGINRNQQAKVFAGHNSEFGEFWFFYPSSETDPNTGENDKYIAYNYRLNHWMVGTLSRTAWADQGAFDLPFAVGSDGYVYQHETGWTNDGASRLGDVYAESGPIEIGQGDRLASIDRIIADEYDTLGSVRATISTRNTPQDSESTQQYTFDQADGYIDVRINARQLQVKLDAIRDDGFKFGTLRMNLKPSSRR